jgi:hypothetical protein
VQALLAQAQERALPPTVRRSPMTSSRQWTRLTIRKKLYRE